MFEAERALLLDRVEPHPMTPGDAQRQLAEATAACRVLQTHAYRLSLFFGGGREAQPAEHDAQRIGARYFSWRDSLYRFAIGEADAPMPGENEHFEAAKDAYNTFATNANAVIRPRLVDGVRASRRKA